MTLLDELFARTHPGAKAERAIISDALGILDAVKQKAAAVRSDGRLSKAGVQAKLVDALTDRWPEVQGLRGRQKEMTADIAKRRLDMLPKRPSDPATMALHGELRAALKAATRGERLRLARDNDEFALAALTAPLVLTGLSDESAAPGQPSDFDLVLQAFQQRNHVELYAGLELRQEAAEAVESAITHAAREICNLAGVTESEVERLISKEDETEDEIDPENLLKLTRADLKALATTDPAQAAAQMRRVYTGKAQLVD